MTHWALQLTRALICSPETNVSPGNGAALSPGEFIISSRCVLQIQIMKNLNCLNLEWFSRPDWQLDKLMTSCANGLVFYAGCCFMSRDRNWAPVHQPKQSYGNSRCFPKLNVEGKLTFRMLFCAINNCLLSGLWFYCVQTCSSGVRQTAALFMKIL